MFLRHSQVIHSLFGVNSLPLDVSARCVAFHGYRGEAPTDNAGFFSDRITIGASLLELMPNFVQVGLGMQRSSRLLVERTLAIAQFLLAGSQRGNKLICQIGRFRRCFVCFCLSSFSLSLALLGTNSPC